MIIKNWCITSNQNGFTSPENLKYYLNGDVYGNIKFKDGTHVSTSSIQSVIELENCKQIYTRNSTYHVFKDEVNLDYEKEYPNAYERLNMICVE